MLSSLVLLILSAADPAPIPAEKCGACHERKYARWSRGRHSRMIQVATKATVLGDFARDSVVLRRKRYGLREEAGHYFVRESYITRDKVERPVSFTLGSRRIQHAAELRHLPFGVDNSTLVSCGFLESSQQELTALGKIVGEKVGVIHNANCFNNSCQS